MATFEALTEAGYHRPQPMALPEKCFLANTGHGAPVGLVGQGSYTVQRKNCFDAPNFIANSNSQLLTFEHH